MRPLGRCAGLQLDDPELGLTPRCVAGGDTCSRSARLAYATDRVLELPARLVQRRGVHRGGVRGVARLLSLESEALTISLFTFRRRTQDRRELRDRVWGFELR